jgi:hypothetical protein
MSVEQDVNYFSVDWWNTLNTPFTKTWRLRNDGDCAWPQGTALVHLDGQDFGLSDRFEILPLSTDERIELSVLLHTPDVVGQYEGRFQLQTAEGEPIGEPLKVKLDARARTSLTPLAQEPVQIAGYELLEWTPDAGQHVWRGKVALWATGGTGEYSWYRDTLDNPLLGPVLEFEWGMCRDFFGSVWVVSGDTQDHEGLYIPYPETCE